MKHLMDPKIKWWASSSGGSFCQLHKNIAIALSETNSFAPETPGLQDDYPF